MTAEQAHHHGPAGLPEPQLGDDMHPLLKKLVENIKPIAIGFGVLILVFGGYGIYDYVQTRRLESSSALLGEIILSTSGEERVKALQQFVEQAPGALKTSGLLELAGALQGLEQYEEAVAVWQRIEGRADPNMLPVAKLGRAQALTMAGKAGQALELLEAYKAAAPESYQVEINKFIAETAEDAGETDKALAAYREMEQSENLGQSTREFLKFKIGKLEKKSRG